MSESVLLIVVDADTAREDKAAVADGVLAHWRQAECPPTRICTTDAVMNDEGSLAEAGLVWLMVDHTGRRALYELVSLAAERHLPVVLTREGETLPMGAAFDAGVTVCPPAAPPEMVCMVLQSLWNQSIALDDLRADLRMLQWQQRELTGQVRRMDEELRLAAQIQREFLPTALPQMQDLSFRVFFRPAGYVSGDIYDVIKLDEHHIGLFLADAVGHGVPAALMTMYIKRSLHTKVVDPALPSGYRLIEPAETLAQLNADLIKHQGDKVRFATACYAVIDCRTHCVRLARAGHPPPILLRASGETEFFEPDGSLLGVFPDETFEQQTFELGPKDRFLLYSDGFEMAFPGTHAPENTPGSAPGNAPDNAAQSNGTRKIASDQYCREFEDFRHDDLDAAIGRLDAKLDTQLGSLNQRDDLTIVCVGASASANRSTTQTPHRAMSAT